MQAANVLAAPVPVRRPEQMIPGRTILLGCAITARRSSSVL